MDIHITYETLFDLLRKERSLQELQALNPRFWRHIVEYLTEREDFYRKTSTIEQERTRIQLNNIKRIVKEIYEHRERKIVHLAVNVIRSDTGYIDTKNMLAEEKLLFDETVNLLKKYKRDVLIQVFDKKIPTIAPDVYEEPEPVENQEQVVEESIDEMTVRFVTSVPKFLGKQKEIYGPFESGDEATLPKLIANILLKKGKAEEV